MKNEREKGTEPVKRKIAHKCVVSDGFGLGCFVRLRGGYSNDDLCFDPQRSKRMELGIYGLLLRFTFCTRVHQATDHYGDDGDGGIDCVPAVLLLHGAFVFGTYSFIRLLLIFNKE